MSYFPKDLGEVRSLIPGYRKYRKGSEVKYGLATMYKEQTHYNTFPDYDSLREFIRANYQGKGIKLEDPSREIRWGSLPLTREHFKELKNILNSVCVKNLQETLKNDK